MGRIMARTSFFPLMDLGKSDNRFFWNNPQARFASFRQLPSFIFSINCPLRQR